MNYKIISALAIGLAVTIPLQGALLTTGIYDEQDVQPNAVDFEMGFSSNATWTTGIGQDLGAGQIISLAEFKANLTTAFASGQGGVVHFDGVAPVDFSGMQAFSGSFAEGAKELSFTNREGNGGSYSISSGGGRTQISGDQYLSTGGNAHFDFVLNGTGFEANEKVVSIGVTLLGREDQGTGRNFRVIGFYTNGVDVSSSSTFRSFDMQNGNTSQDSFAGIVAPAGHWIERVRVHSDNGVFTGIDDLAFTTAIIPEPSTIALLLGSAALLVASRRRRR